MPRWLEKLLDSVVPRVAVCGRTRGRFSPQTFAALRRSLARSYRLRSRSAESFVVEVRGRTSGKWSQGVDVLFRGRAPEADMYRNLKSRIQCSLGKDGALEVESFEHVAGLNEERVAFETVLQDRLDAALDFIEQRADR